MTGYGRGDCARDGFKVTVELSSVNRKQAEISVNLPREMEMLEAQIRDLGNRYIARGRLTVRVSLHAADGRSSARMHLNASLAKAHRPREGAGATMKSLPSASAIKARASTGRFIATWNAARPAALSASVSVRTGIFTADMSDSTSSRI